MHGLQGCEIKSAYHRKKQKIKKISRVLHGIVQLLGDWRIEVNRPLRGKCLQTAQDGMKGGAGMTNENMAEAIVRIEERSKRNEGRIRDLEGAQDTLNRIATSVEVIAAKQAIIEHSVDTLTKKVDALEQKPAKRWETMVEKALMVLVGAILTLMLAQIGLQG